MKEYIRMELIITEFDAEDVITTSGVPSNPQNSPQNNVTQRNSPIYSSSGGADGNWLTWLQ